MEFVFSSFHFDTVSNSAPIMVIFSLPFFGISIVWVSIAPRDFIYVVFKYALRY